MSTLKEQSIVDRVEIVGDYKHIQIRVANRIIDNETNEIKAEKFHRVVCEPGDIDKAKQYGVEKIALAVWDEDIVNRYRDFLLKESSQIQKRTV